MDHLFARPNEIAIGPTFQNDPIVTEVEDWLRPVG